MWEIYRISALNIVFQLVSKGAAALVFIILARNLSQNLFGEFFYGYTVARYMTLTLMMGSSAVLVKHWGDISLSNPIKTKKNHGYMNWYMIVALSCSAFICITIAVYDIIFASETISLFEQATSLLFTALIPISLIQNYYISIQKPHYSGFFSCSFNLSWCVLTATAFYVFRLSEWGYIALLLIGLLFINGAIFSYSLRKINLTFSRPTHQNYKFVIAHFATVSFGLADIFIIKMFMTERDVAIFAVAFQLVSLVTFVLGAITSAIVSSLSENYKKETPEQFQVRVTSFARLTAIPAILILFILLFFGESIVSLYGDGYGEAYVLLLIFIIGNFVNVACGFNGWLLNLTGQEGYVGKVFLFVLALKVLLGVFIIKDIGLIGMVSISVLTLIIWNLLLLRRCIRTIGIDTSAFGYFALGKN
ncbi:hypothetical protein OAT86_00480 [Planktomarina sp.]|nr:hypothetical protein [Planktomarina sp.]